MSLEDQLFIYLGYLIGLVFSLTLTFIFLAAVVSRGINGSRMATDMRRAADSLNQIRVMLQKDAAPAPPQPKDAEPVSLRKSGGMLGI